MERLSLDTDPPPADIENGMEKNVSYGKEMDEFVNSWNGLDPQRDPFEMDRLSRISDWVERSEAGVIDSDRDTDIDFTEDVRRASAIYEEGEIRTDEERREIQRDGRWESEEHTDNMDILHLDDHLEGGSFVLSQLPSSYPNTVPRHLIGSSEEEGLEECDAIGSSNIPLRPLIYSSPHRPTSSHGRRLSQPLLDSLDRLLGTNAPVFTSEEVAFSSDLSHTITQIDQYSRRPTLIDMSPLPSIEAKENSGKTLRKDDTHSEVKVPSSDVEEGYSEVERDSKMFEVISGIVGDHKVITNVIKKKEEEVITMNLINLESDGEILMSPPKYSELKTPDPHDNLASLLNYVEREEGRDDERKKEREEERDDDRFRDPFDVDIDWKRDIEGGGEMQRSYHLHTQTKKNRSVPLAILMQRITSSDSEGEGQRSRERNREVRGKRNGEKEETEEEEDVLDMYRNMVVSVERDGVIEQGEEEELIRSIKRTSGLWESEIPSLFPANVWVDKVEEVEVVVTECSSKSRRSELSEDFIPEERNSEHIERREEHRENRENERENEGSDTMIILEPSREMEETSLDTKPSMTSYWIEENEEREEREGGLEKKRDPAIDHLIHSREQSDMSGNTYIINRSIDTTGRESGDSRQTYDIDYVLEESEHREYREAESAQCEILFPIGHQMKTEFDTVPSTGRSSEDESERTTESGESRQPEYTNFTGETLQKTSTTVEDSETTEENEESDYDNVLKSIRENEEHQLERENSEENEDGAVEKEGGIKYEGERRVDSTSDTEKEKKEGIKEEESEETVDTREEDMEETKEEEEKSKESSDTSDSEEQMEEVADDEGWESDKKSEIGEIIVLEERLEDTSGGESRAEEERPDDERSSEESGVEKTPDYEKGTSVETEENREENRKGEEREEKEEEEREMDETPADSQAYPSLLIEKGEGFREDVQITINDDNLIDSEEKNPESGRLQKEGGVPTRKGSTALSIGRSDTLQSDNSVATFVSSDMDRASIVKLNYHSNVDKAAWKGDVREVNLDEVERFWDYRYTKEQDSMREVEKEEKEREDKETECERLLAERVRRYYGMKTPLPETPDMDRRNQQENSVPLTPLPLLDVPSSPNVFQLPSSPPIQITLEVPPDPSKEETEGESSISIGHMSTDSENEEGQKTLSERFFRLTKLDIDTDSDDVGRVERKEAAVSSSGSRRIRKLRNSPHPLHPPAYSSSSSRKGRGLSSSTLYKRRVPRHTIQQTNNIPEKNMDIPDIHFDLNSPRLSDTDESLISDEERRILMNESPSGRKSVTFSEKLADYPSPRPFIRTDSALLKIRCSKGILKKEDKQRESIRRILEYAGERLHKDLCLLVEERDRTVSALELTPLDNFGLSPQTSHYQTRYRDQLSQNKGALDARIDTVWRKLKEAAVDMNKCAWIYSVTDSSQLTLKVKRRVLPRRSTTFFNVERRNKSDIELASEYAQKLAKMRGEMMRKDSEDTVDEGYLGLLKRVSRTLGSSENIARM